MVARTLGSTSALGEIDDEAREVIAGALDLARERLGMEIAWITEFTDDREVLRVVAGEQEDWDIAEGDSVAAVDSYCVRMLDGRMPRAIPDASKEPAVADLPITTELDIGAYVGVPLVFDGGLRGAFCCLRHSPARDLDDRDVEVVEFLAQLVADELAFRQALRALRRREMETASLQALLAALEGRDEYTGDHSQAVVDLARAVATRLGIDNEELEAVEQVALLHDLGKVGIPDAVLRKPGPLTDAEWEILRTHPGLGADIIARLETLAHLRPAIRAEHERWDGTGYPDGLAGEAIPIPSRITLTCDAFHAMVSDRPYRAAMPKDQAIEELRRCAGTMFWPDAVDALIDHLQDGTASA